MELKAYKMDGLGNDFLIIDRRKNPVSITKKKIIELGKRNNIGFDQLILLNKIDPKASNYIPITIFNSDGDEVEACGNGSRCVVKLICDEKKIEHTAIVAGGRVLKGQKISKDSVRILMGKPTFDWQEIPLSKNIDHKNINIKVGSIDLKNGFALNVGNPHIIFFVDDCFKYDLKKIGPLIEKNELFPKKINVTFAQVKDNVNILVNVWERGAGLTKACGTAACATTVAAFEKKIASNNTNIHFKEGFLKIEYDRIISMTGPVSGAKEININKTF